MDLGATPTDVLRKITEQMNLLERTVIEQGNHIAALAQDNAEKDEMISSLEDTQMMQQTKIEVLEKRVNKKTTTFPKFGGSNKKENDSTIITILSFFNCSPNPLLYSIIL